MKYLREEDWSFCKKDNNKEVFDGEKFEDLTASLLEELFDGNWIQTQKTWDGGKDFYKEDKNSLDWVECKIYKTNLDIKTIGKTLVMVIIKDNVKNLYFFSYSPMVSTAYEQLAQFSKNSNINIIVYDDVKLEELILNSKETKKKYFKKINVIDYKFNNKDTVYTNLSTNIDISILNVENVDKHKKRKEKLLYNQTFIFEIIIINNSIYDKKYKIDFENIVNSEINLWLLSNLNSSIYDEVQLQACEIKSIELFLKCRSIGKKTIPEIDIQLIKNNQTIDIIQTQKKDIEVNFISHPILVGLQLEQTIQNFETKISTNNSLCTHVISGISGVGKSRLSSEFIDKLLSQNYSIFKYDCNSPEHYLASIFLQSLLSYLYKIPIVHDEPHEGIFDLLTKLIKMTKKINESDIDDIVDLLVKGIKKYRLSIVIDNIQSLESLTFKILSKVYNYLYKCNSQISIIFIFNLDELTLNSSSKIFYDILKDDNRITLIGIDEFKEFEAKQFINNLIKFEDTNQRFSEQYPETTQLIIDHVGKKALNLFQTILYLSDENIILLERDCFLIKNIEKFHLAITGLNKNIETIIEKRYKHLEKYHPKLIHTLKYISFFEEIALSDIENLQIYKYVEKLVEINFLKESNGVVSFYHGSIKKFMYQKKFWLDLELVNTIIEDKKSFYSDYKLIDYILELLNDSFNINDIYTYIESVSLIPNLQTNLFAKLLEKLLHKNKKEFFVSYQKELILINKILPLLTFNMDIYEKVNLMKRIYLHRFNDFPKYKKCYKELSLILREYSSWSCQINQAQDGYKELDDFLIKLNSIDDDNEEELVNRVKADLINRQCVTLKFLERYSDAEQKGLESLKISQKYNFKTEECLNYIDLGYVFFGCNKNSKILIKYWQSAVDLFKNNITEICKYNHDMKYAGKLIELHLQVLNKDEKAFSEISDLIQLCKSEYSDYYLKQSILLDIVNHFIHFKLDNLLNKINILEDLAASTNESNFYKKALYARSKYFYLRKDIRQSLKILKNIIWDLNNDNNLFINSNLCLISDFIRQCNELNTQNYNCKKVDQIFQLSNITKNEYLDNNFTTIFNINGINLPLP